MHTVAILIKFFEPHIALAYVVLFFGMILEGEVVLIMAGILIHIGVLDIIFVIPVVVSGLISKSFIGYNIGSLLKNKYPESKFFKYLDKKVNYFLPSFQRKPFWSIFISKFLIGLNNLAIIFAGYMRVSWKIFIKAELISNAVWMTTVLCLGYFFSYMALSITKEFKKFTILIILFMVGFWLMERFVTFIHEIVADIYQKFENGRKD